MAIQTQTFQGGTVGSQFTQANSGMPSVNPNGSAAGVYADLPVTDPIFGRTKGLKVAAGSGVTFDARYNAAAATVKAAAQMEVYLSGLPSGSINDLATIRGTIQNSGLRHSNSDGRITPLANGSAITGSVWDIVDITKFILLDLYCEEDPTNAAGIVKWRWFDPLSAESLTTPQFTYTAINQVVGDTDLHVIQTGRFGKMTSAAIVPDMYWAHYAFDDTATDFITTPVMPESGIENNDPGTFTHRVMLDFVGAFTGGVPPLEAEVTQASGETVTLVQDPTNPLKWYFNDVERDDPIVLDYRGLDANDDPTTWRQLTIPVGTGLTNIVRVGPEEFWIDGALR